jgi:hypothetical protein
MIIVHLIPCIQYIRAGDLTERRMPVIEHSRLLQYLLKVKISTTTPHCVGTSIVILQVYCNLGLNLDR